MVLQMGEHAHAAVMRGSIPSTTIMKKAFLERNSAFRIAAG